VIKDLLDSFHAGFWGRITSEHGTLSAFSLIILAAQLVNCLAQRLEFFVEQHVVAVRRVANRVGYGHRRQQYPDLKEILEGVSVQSTGIPGAAPEASAAVEEIVITAVPGQRLIPLPEGSAYLGFIFARGGSPQQVEAALRHAHSQLRFDIATALETFSPSL